MSVGGQPALKVLIDRLRHSRRIDDIVVATTVNRADDLIVDLCKELGVKVFRGSEHDVLGRVVGALDENAADICVEITADCPLLDPAIVDEAIAEFLMTRSDNPYVSNSDPHRSVPAGLDVQVFEVSALRQLDTETQDPMDREHVSYGFYRPESGGRWRPRFLRHAAALGGESYLVTLDYVEDLRLIDKAHRALGADNSRYGAAALVAWLASHPEEQAQCRKVRGL